MDKVSFESFQQYATQVSLSRIRVPNAPEEMRPWVKVYQDALRQQCEDPEECRLDTLGPNEHYNAMQAVKGSINQARLAANQEVHALGNCPRCMGRKTIAAYRHIHGGICFACDGRGSVSTSALHPDEK